MSELMKKVVLVSASPKIDQTEAVSQFLAARGEDLLAGEGLEVVTIPVRRVLLHRETESAFESMQSAQPFSKSDVLCQFGQAKRTSVQRI